MLASVRRFTQSLFGRGESRERATVGRRSGIVDLGEWDGRGRRYGSSEGRAAPSRRPPVEIEAEMDRVRQKLDQVRTAIGHERDYAQRAGGRANQGIIDTLKKRGDRLRDKLRALNDELLQQVPRTTTALSPKTPPPRRVINKARFVAQTETRGTDKTLAQAARSAFKRGSFENASVKAVFEKIVSDLADGSAEVQLHALERLGEIESPAAIPVFAAAARHQREELRLAALRGLLAMRHPATRDILSYALSDPSHRVRVWAVRGLYGLDDPALGDLLCLQLKDPHPLVRRTAATYLSWKRVPGADRHLTRHLHDESSEVRAAVATALGQCASERAVFKLIGLLREEAAEVRVAALVALERILGEVPNFDTEADGEVRRAAVKELKSWWRKHRVARLIGGAAESAETDEGLDDESFGAGDEAGEEDAGLDDAAPDLGGDLDAETGEFGEGDKAESTT